MINIWAAEWRSNCLLDGETRYIIYDRGFLPVLFRTRRECREFIKERYGYIATRPDLQAEPYGWRVPRAIKVKIEVLEI